MFGCDLTEHTQLFSEDDSIPHIVKSCTRFIEKHGIIFGIYRLSGMRVNIHKLRQDFDKNPKISMIDSEAISNDAHAVACVLKQYFRELPIPLLTFHMYERFIELFKQSNIIDSTTSATSSNNNNNNHKNDNVDDDDATSTINERDISITNVTFNNNENNEIQHDKKVGQTANTTNASMMNKSKSSTQQTPMTTATTNQVQNTKQTHFTSSASDSQLLSLSSVVTTTTSDIRYHVKLDDLKCLLQQLPRPHYQTLKFLMRHLACIAVNGEKTGMDSKNVAIVWAPNLLKPRELELSAGLETLQVIGLQAVITEQLIKHHKFLFDDIDQVVETMDSSAQELQPKDHVPPTGNDVDNKQIDQSPDGECSIKAATPSPTTQQSRPSSSASQVDTVMITSEDKEQLAPKDVDNNQDMSKKEGDKDNS